MGIEDVLGFHYLQAPSRDSLIRSLEQLLLLGSLDRRSVMERCGLDGGIADQTGQKMALLLLDPLYSRLLILSKEYHSSAEVDVEMNE